MSELPSKDNLNQPPVTPLQEASASQGMGKRLGVLLILFVIAAGAIFGYRYYLDSQLPQPDPDHIKRQRDPSEIPEPDGVTLEAPDPA